MRVFVTGATGFVGRALIPRLQRDGHAVVAWVRSPVCAWGLLYTVSNNSALHLTAYVGVFLRARRSRHS